MLPTDTHQNLSIELEQQPSNFDEISMAKCDQQLTQQLYQIARKIAESDRNNQLYRQTKKQKGMELQQLRNNQLDRQYEYQQILQRVQSKKKQLQKYTKSTSPTLPQQYQQFHSTATSQLQTLTTQQQNLAHSEHQLIQNSNKVSKQNEKLQRKIAALQIQYQLLVKQNKNKTVVLNKIKKQREERSQKYVGNQGRIGQLQQRCEQSKRHAEQLQQQLKQQMKIQSELQDAIRDRQHELETKNKQKQQTQRKIQENKRTVNKLVNTIKSIENQISQKIQESQRLQNIHANLQQKINQINSKQIRLDEIMGRRRAILASLRAISEKVQEQVQGINLIKNIENCQQHQQLSDGQYGQY